MLFVALGSLSSAEEFRTSESEPAQKETPNDAPPESSPASEREPESAPVPLAEGKQPTSTEDSAKREAAAPQLSLQIKFSEITRPDPEPVTLDWLIRNTPALAVEKDLQIHTRPTQGAVLTETWNETLKTTNQISEPASQPFSAVLGPEQGKAILAMIEKRSGVDVLSAPGVTTLSGRQAQVSVTQMRQIVMGVRTNLPGKPSPNVTYQTTNAPVGVTVDISPKLTAGDQLIQLTGSATVTEFLGYDDPGPFQVKGAGESITATAPLPQFRVRTTEFSEAIPSNGYLLCGGLVSHEPIEKKRRIPLLADIPLVGRLFSYTQRGDVYKNLLVFITAEQVEADGKKTD